MKPSIQWCKLYSTESKYSFTLVNSKLTSQIPFYLAGLSCLVSFIILSHFGLHLSYQIIALCSLTTALFTLILCRYLTFNEFNINAFILSEDGVLTLGADQHFQLGMDSLVFSYGCALSLITVNPKMLLPIQVTNKATKPISRFIFKDALNDEDYRRLCRIIAHQKNANRLGN